MQYGKVIGTGNTATVYEWGEDKVLKLFYQGYPKDAVEKEFHNAMAIRDMNFAKPKAYEMIFYQGRLGIVYDKIKGESLLDWVMKTSDLDKCAEYMVKLHKAILQNKVNNIPDYKEFLRYQISKEISIDPKKRQILLQMLEKLPNGNTLCHGDFHPANILIAHGQATVIDYMNLCRGEYLYDVARTVFLIECAPAQAAQVADRKKSLKFRKTLSGLYLSKMDVTRDMIQDYLSVIVSVD